jgi:beta-N-acetylhexosaminidase
MTGSRLMAAFAGTELPANVAAALARGTYAGVTLFRAHNVDTLDQVRRLNESIQSAAPADTRPLLIATDQETGQLSAIGDGTTEFAGAMALGAADDEALTERLARAIGLELRALGVNVNYSPACDLADTPENPAMGIRSFGDDPQAVARHVAATVRGLQAEGVAATAKHFPGIGAAAVDTHHELAVVPGDAADLERGQLVPFRAAIEAGARVMMAGHVALPDVTGDPALPASLAEPVLRGLLRDRLGFEGVTITDALDMGALAQGTAQVVDVIAALRAGEDLLLATADEELVARAEQAVAQAELRGLIDVATSRVSAVRLQRLREWLAGFDRPPLDVVGRSEHQALARELAAASVTLVRNDEGLLPLRPPSGARLCVVEPAPANLTPADTSVLVEPGLGAAIRQRWPGTEVVRVSAEPSEVEIGAAREAATGCDVIVLGTSAAHLQASHARLADALLATGRPTITVALRTPWDLSAYPRSGTHLCTYSILRPSMDALTAAIFGDTSCPGRLPVVLGDLHPRGHGLTTWH